jgi:tetratricopeptide (TPR) repeat protein
VAELEKEFSRAPASVEAGAALAIALGSNSRVQEAHIVLARLRQIPGKEEDPLIDYVDATLSMSSGEPQRSLVLFTRARDAALRDGRGELIGQIRASRGRLLSTMGQREEARAELALARAEIERAGDDASLGRVLNDFAIEFLQEGDLDRGSELLQAAVEAFHRAGDPAYITRINLGLVSVQRGRPDLAEPLIREVVTAWRTGTDKRRLGEGLGYLAEPVRDLGRQREAIEILDESIGLLSDPGGEASLISSLVSRAAIALDGARLSTAEDLAQELESVAGRVGDRRGTAYTHHIRGCVAAARGELPRARERFEVAQRLLTDNGDLDQAADLAVARAELVRRSGNAAEAGRILDSALAPLAGGASGIASAFLAGTLRVRIDVDTGRLSEASSRLAKIDAASATSPSVSRRIGYLAARAAVAAAEKRHDAALADLDSAIATSTAAGGTMEALELRLDRARYTSQTDLPAAKAAAGKIATDAAPLGLEDLVRRARALSAAP